MIEGIDVQGGAAAARLAHNQEVAGASPVPAPNPGREALNAALALISGCWPEMPAGVRAVLARIYALAEQPRATAEEIEALHDSVRLLTEIRASGEFIDIVDRSVLPMVVPAVSLGD